MHIGNRLFAKHRCVCLCARARRRVPRKKENSKKPNDDLAPNETIHRLTTFVFQLASSGLPFS